MVRLRVSDYAACADVTDSNVRYYDNLGLLGPVSRNPDNQYRVFDPLQVPHMYLLKTLREMDFSVRQLREFGQNRTPDVALELYRECDERLAGEIAALRARKEMLRSYMSLIREGRSAKPGEIELRVLRERHVRLVPLPQADGGCWRMRGAFEKVRRGGNAGCPLGYAYRGFSDLLERPDWPAQLVSYDPQGQDKRPAGRYLVGTEASDGEDGLPRRMLDYAQGKGLKLCGPAYTVRLLDAASVADTEQYLLQITVAVKRAQQARYT